MELNNQTMVDKTIQQGVSVIQKSPIVLPILFDLPLYQLMCFSFISGFFGKEMCNLSTWWWHLSDIEPKRVIYWFSYYIKPFTSRSETKFTPFLTSVFATSKHIHVVCTALYNALLRKHTPKSQLITPTPNPIFQLLTKNLNMTYLNIFWKTKFQRIYNTEKFQKNTLMGPNIG